MIITDNNIVSQKANQPASQRPVNEDGYIAALIADRDVLGDEERSLGAFKDAIVALEPTHRIISWLIGS